MTADREQASRMAGFAVPVVDPSVLPRGVGRTPERIMVVPARETAITFDRDRALDYLRDNGRPDARLPERFDGTRLVVQLPAVVVQQFAGRDGGPALLVGKAGMLGLDTEGGASLEELREVVLDLPGLPEATVAQLRAIGDWRTTLPLPVPTDEVSWDATQVEGAEAISFADPSGPAARPALAAVRLHLGGGRRGRGRRGTRCREQPLLSRGRRAPGPVPGSRRSPRPGCARPTGPGSPSTT